MDSAIINIVPFQPVHQPGIDLLFASIRHEFPEEMFPDPGMTISKLSLQPNRKYWVALANDNLIGTVGLLLLADKFSCLKSMFLLKDFRGDERRIAEQLMQTAIDQAIKNGCKRMCLGTMEQFAGARRFYEKNGFICSNKEQLPADFPPNSVDTVFYMKDL